MRVVKAKRRRVRFVDPAAARKATALAPDYRAIHLAADSRVPELTELIRSAMRQHGDRLIDGLDDANIDTVLSADPRFTPVALADTIENIDELVAEILVESATGGAEAMLGALKASLTMVSPEAIALAANVDLARIVPLTSSQHAIRAVLASNLAGDATRSQVVQMVMRELAADPTILLGSFGLRPEAFEAVAGRVGGQLERWTAGRVTTHGAGTTFGRYVKPPTFGSTQTDLSKLGHHLEIVNGKPGVWTARNGPDEWQLPGNKLRVVPRTTATDDMGDAAEWVNGENRGVYAIKSGRETVGFVPYEDTVEMVDGRRVVTGRRSAGRVIPGRGFDPWFKAQPNARAWVGELHREGGRKALRVRAEMIARTETMRAANGGARAAMATAQGQGLLPIDAHLEWIVTPDDRLCARCSAMDFQTIPLLTGSFTEPSGASTVDHPPIHPRCRCTLAYVPGATVEKSIPPQSSDR